MLAVVATLGGVVLITLWSFACIALGVRLHEDTAKKEGLAGLGGLKLVKQAKHLFDELGVTSSLDEVEIINSEHKAAIDQWLQTYKKWEKK
jgi:hypothetical protein